jgi:hypothetical protein
MILVVPSSTCASLMQRLGISQELLARTVNERHLGLVSDGLDRVVAVHWIDPESAVLIDSIVTKRSTDDSAHCTVIHEVVAQLAIRVSQVLPAGRFDRETPLPKLLHVVSASFGLKISCHSSEGAAYLYEGPWDGSAPRLYGDTPASFMYIAGSFYPDLKRCELVWSLDLHRYLAWFNEHVAHSVEASMPITTSVGLIQAQKKLLEELFPAEWFLRERSRQRQHPGYIRWQLYADLLARKGRFRLPDEDDLVHRFLSALLDNIFLIEATRGTLDAQKLGDLANYGDEAVFRRLRTDIQHPSKFFDILVEVSCAAWHVSHRHEVKATEEPGMPDLTLGILGWQLPIQAECKRVGKDAGYSRFKHVIEVGNRQIKRRDQRCYGLLYIDVSDRVDKTTFGDPRPDEIAKIQETVQRYLCMHYTSIGGVVLLWKGHTTHTLSTKDDRAARAYDLGYRSHLIRHRMPEEPLPGNAEPIMLGYTGILHIDEAFAD